MLFDPTRPCHSTCSCLVPLVWGPAEKHIGLYPWNSPQTKDHHPFSESQTKPPENATQQHPKPGITARGKYITFSNFQLNKQKWWGFLFKIIKRKETRTSPSEYPNAGSHDYLVSLKVVPKNVLRRMSCATKVKWCSLKVPLSFGSKKKQSVPYSKSFKKLLWGFQKSSLKCPIGILWEPSEELLVKSSEYFIFQWSKGRLLTLSLFVIDASVNL